MTQQTSFLEDITPAREPRVEFLAGVLSQWAWGDGRKSAEQRAVALQAAREALRALSIPVSGRSPEDRLS